MNSAEVVWKVPVEFASSYILRTNQDTVLATGEDGKMYKIRKKDGVIIARKQFSTKTDHPEILSNGEVIYLDGNPFVQYLDGKLDHKKTIYLPPLIEYPELIRRFPGSGFKRIAPWVYYSADNNRLYVSSMWGEIYVLDLISGEWIRTYKVTPRCPFDHGR